jgi:hypothetical protein
MTVAVGTQLNAEIEAGGRTGLGQGAGARPGRELSANWFQPASGNLATNLVPATQSFRSSWQAVVNAWMGVSRGTGGTGSQEADRAGAAKETLPEQSGQAASTIAEAGSKVQANLTATQQIVPQLGAARQAEVQAQIGRAQANPAPDAITHLVSAPSIASEATEQAGTANRGRTGSTTAQRNNRENTTQTATMGTQPVSFTAAAPVPLSFPQDTVLTGWSSARSADPAPLPDADESAPGQAATRAAGAVGRTAEAGIGTETMRTGLASPPVGTTQSHAVREIEASSPGETAEALASVQETPPAFAESSAGHAQRAASTTRAAANSGNLLRPSASLSKADNIAYTKTGASATESAASQAMASGAAPTSADATQAAGKESVGYVAQRAAATAHVAANGENLFRSSASLSPANNFTYAKSGASATESAAASGAAPTSADTTQAAGKESAEQVGHRAASRGADGETAVPPLVAAEPSSIAAPAGLRTPEAAHIYAAPAGSPSQSAAPAIATSASDTFAALDRGSALGAPSWTHAAGQHAEAGFEDPALGWVGVRADLNPSGVHATLVPSSTDAAQALSGHIAGLSSHLAEQQAHVASLSMASPGGSATDSGAGQLMRQGTGENTQGNVPEQSQAGSQKSGLLESSASAQAVTAGSGAPDTRTYPDELRGTRISVMA